MLTAIPTSTVLTNQPPSPGVVVSGQIDQCFHDSPYRLVLDVVVTGASITVLLYRWNADAAEWVQSADGPLPCAVGITETRWETSSISAYYCLRIESGSGAATYSQQRTS